MAIPAGAADNLPPVAAEAAVPSKRMAADFVMGAAAAVVAKSGAAPVERVKLLLQNQAELLRSGRLVHPYEGIADCFASVLREEGVLAFWRGNQANVVRYFPTQGNFFASFALGWSVMMFSSIRAYPYDTLRRRIMLTSGQSFKYQNSLHAL